VAARCVPSSYISTIIDLTKLCLVHQRKYLMLRALIIVYPENHTQYFVSIKIKHLKTNQHRSTCIEGKEKFALLGSFPLTPKPARGIRLPSLLWTPANGSRTVLRAAGGRPSASG